MADGRESMVEEMKKYYFPDVVVREIFANLGARDAWTASQTCVQWRRVGLAARKLVRVLRLSDFYADLVTEERFIERPVFYRREDLNGLTLVKTAFVKKMVEWLRGLYPNITDLAFRNFIRRSPSTGPMPHPSRFHVFVINELMSHVGVSWPLLESLDVSGEIVDVRSLHQVSRWPHFGEIRISGADLSCNMLRSRRMVSDALTKTFWPFPLEAIRMSNMETIFEMTFTRMTSFKALNHKSLTTGWLNAFLKEAINLRSLAIDCRYVHDENILLIGNLVDMRDLILRNCVHVKDFGPLGSLRLLETAMIDFGDKGTEEQMCRIVVGSRNWRCIIFNELVESVGNRFLAICADHFRRYKCPLLHLELNTEKTVFQCVNHNWRLPEADVVGIQAVLRACPLLEVFGVCTWYFNDECLLNVAENCPRMRNVIACDSKVTDEGVRAYFEALRQKWNEKFLGLEYSGGCVDVRGTKCTRALGDEVKKRFGGRLKIIV